MQQIQPEPAAPSAPTPPSAPRAPSACSVINATVANVFNSPVNMTQTIQQQGPLPAGKGMQQQVL